MPRTAVSLSRVDLSSFSRALVAGLRVYEGLPLHLAHPAGPRRRLAGYRSRLMNASRSSESDAKGRKQPESDAAWRLQPMAEADIRSVRSGFRFVIDMVDEKRSFAACGMMIGVPS